MTNPDTKNDDAIDEPIGYPRGSDVAFPYSSPYRQQTDLMDCVLQALLHSNSQMQQTSNSAAKVLLLESPTGTGKSLSLACAALTWLDHQDSCDLLPTQQQQTDLRLSKNDTPTTTTTNSSSVDWLDAWISPKEREEQEQRQKQRDAFIHHRQQLEQELSKRRQQLQPSSLPNNNNNNHSNDPRMMRRKQVQTAIRKAISASASASTMHSRKRFRNKSHLVTPNNHLNLDDEPFCLEEYHSDDDMHNDGRFRDSAVWKEQDEQDEKESFVRENLVALLQDTYHPRKIIYAARTHSQLSQFVSELRKIPRKQQHPLRVVHLGSRQNLCTNTTVRKHANTEKAITEACLDLQEQAKKKNASKRKQNDNSDNGCPWLSSKDTAIPELALQILSQPTDIEEVAGFATGDPSYPSSTLACGYYASRLAVATAQVIVMPYSMLLNPQTRKSVGITDLSSSFVIVDEAHNLPEAIRNLHACRLSSDTIERALLQLQHYVTKYKDRLAGRNLFYLGQIRRILLAFQKYLKKYNSSSNPSPPHPQQSRSKSTMQTASELLMQLKLDNINIFRLLRYLNRSKLSQKLLGFTKLVNQSKLEENQNQVTSHTNNPDEFVSKHVSAMSIVETFLEKLTLSEKEGKIVTDWPCDNDENLDPSSRSSSNVQFPTLRYVLLHPAACFENVIKEAHAVALVGGTLRPFAHVAAELLYLGDRRCGPSSSSSSHWLYEAAKADEILQTATQSFVQQEETKSASYFAPDFTAFTCDHVVPPSNVLLQCLARGPTGTPLDFRFQSRSNVRVMNELGKTLVRICQTVPGGVVVFLPSYSYEAQLVRHWKSSGIWQELALIKKVHREPKSSQNVESALQSYARDAASSNNGAILLSIVGGKMSEGINFSDDMARCVCCVGLPYPDITDPELVEKMATLDALAGSSQASCNHSKAMITGQAYYQNLCMRAVNQSVGRAIRHAKDYAAIVLIDQRYTTDHRIWAGLPSWLKKGDGTMRWKEDRDLEHSLDEMKKFFHGKVSSSK